ncbi:hypothetical protein [Amycolatopsis benzoatilytica]|uniref:hypothetical protein n=1 Tax=Amycolatopsis benzoatilytica TaxID=346045 RepID=UPI00036447C8|nr:hypothetical protein [Amycolatopsis benzoatilytica]
MGAAAAGRWLPEAALLLRSEGRTSGPVVVRLTGRHRLPLNVGDAADHPSHLLPVLPDAATWVPPDLELLHAGLIDVDQLHPLVASALRPDHRPLDLARPPDSATSSRPVDCRGATHRIGVVNGELPPLDHLADEVRREKLLGALGGAELPCLRAIDEAHRYPENLVDVRARLDHGDTAGALAAVENLLGPDVLLRSGALRDELESAVRRKVAHGLYRAELTGHRPLSSTKDSGRRTARAHPRHATTR